MHDRWKYALEQLLQVRTLGPYAHVTAPTIPPYNP